jgi:hypothetical protein
MLLLVWPDPEHFEPLTLNQRVAGSSPAAPTIQPIEIESKFFERASHRLKLYRLWFQRGSNDCARAGAGKFFSQPRCKESGPPGYMDRPPTRGAGVDRGPTDLFNDLVGAVEEGPGNIEL